MTDRTPFDLACNIARALNPAPNPRPWQALDPIERIAAIVRDLDDARATADNALRCLAGALDELRHALSDMRVEAARDRELSPGWTARDELREKDRDPGVPEREDDE
jgi:hypothetical protein